MFMKYKNDKYIVMSQFLRLKNLFINTSCIRKIIFEENICKVILNPRPHCDFNDYDKYFMTPIYQYKKETPEFETIANYLKVATFNSAT